MLNLGHLDTRRFITVAVMIVGLYALQVYQLRYVMRAAREPLRADDALMYLELSAHAVTDTESFGRAYLLTGDDRYLVSFKSAANESRRILAVYEQSAFEAGTPAPEIRRIKTQAEASLQALGEMVEAYKKYGREGAMKYMRAEPENGLGRSSAFNELPERYEDVAARGRAIKAELHRHIVLAFWIGETTQAVAVAALIVTLGVVFKNQKRFTNDLAESQRGYRVLVERMERVREDERARLAREIHDELGQSLTALKMTLGSTARRLHKTEDGTALQSIVEAGEMADNTIRSLQRIATELRPAILDQLGLVAAVEWQAREFKALSGVDVTAKLPAHEVPLTSDERISLYRVLQESLTNVARHAHARHVTITLSDGSGALLLEVADDGVGFVQDGREAASPGLAGMRERAHLIHAEMTLRSEAGAGTTVSIQLPRRATAGGSFVI